MMQNAARHRRSLIITDSLRRIGGWFRVSDFILAPSIDFIC